MDKKVRSYWKNLSKVTKYHDQLYGQTDFIVQNMNRYIRKNKKFTVCEIGANVGRNLIGIKEFFSKSTISGNDISKKALEETSLKNEIVDCSTDEYLKKMEPVDIILSSMHMIHLPNSMDDILKEYIPLKFKNKFFCFEQNVKEDTKSNVPKFPRDFDVFFEDSLKVIDKVYLDSRGKEQILWIYEHK